MERLFTIEEYHRMAEAGILHEDDRVELIEGKIIQKAAIGSRHAACVKRLNKLLVRDVGDSGVVGAQDSVVLPVSSEVLGACQLVKRIFCGGKPVVESLVLLG